MHVPKIMIIWVKKNKQTTKTKTVFAITQQPPVGWPAQVMWLAAILRIR